MAKARLAELSRMDEHSGHSRFMDYLLFRSIKGEVEPPEDDGVLEWRRSSPANEAYFQELEQLLDLTQYAYRIPDVGSRRPPAAADLVQPAREHEGEEARKGMRSRRDRSLRFSFVPRRARRAWKVLAGAAIAIAVGLFVYQRPPTPSDDFLGLGIDEFVTGSNDVATVQLRDGTVVRLAPQSRLRVGGTPGERTVNLDGRAYFAVSKMDGRPFIVRTGGGDAVVLGTRFEAEARGSELRVLVVEGSVALSAPGSHLELGAGQMARAVEGAVSTPVTIADPEELLGWMGDFLVFQQTSVEEVGAEIKRRFGVDVVIRGNVSGSHTVTAWFADPSPEGVVLVICKVLAAQCSMGSSQVIIDVGTKA